MKLFLFLAIPQCNRQLLSAEIKTGHGNVWLGVETDGGKDDGRNTLGTFRQDSTYCEERRHYETVAAGETARLPCRSRVTRSSHR